MDNRHIDEILHIIDDGLLEEEIVLEGLKKAVEQNAMPEAEAAANFAAYKGARDNEEHSELYRIWVASHNQPPEVPPAA